MSVSLRTRIVRIGNSQGIRIPKLLLEQTNLNGDVELEVQNEQIIVRAAFPVRHGWDQTFQVMAERGDDSLLDPEILHSSMWDEEEWQW